MMIVTTTIPPISTALSLVPKTAMAQSLRAAGVMSMNLCPMVSTREGADTKKEESISENATANPVATNPARK